MAAISTSTTRSAQKSTAYTYVQTAIKVESASSSSLMLELACGYKQSPVRPLCLQEAPGGQPPIKQVSAQYLSPEDESCRTHCGVAVVPSGTSVGHALLVHLGVHVSPSKPWILTSTSSERHGGFSWCVEPEGLGGEGGAGGAG